VHHQTQMLSWTQVWKRMLKYVLNYTQSETYIQLYCQWKYWSLWPLCKLAFWCCVAKWLERRNSRTGRWTFVLVTTRFMVNTVSRTSYSASSASLTTKFTMLKRNSDASYSCHLACPVPLSKYNEQDIRCWQS